MSMVPYNKYGTALFRAGTRYNPYARAANAASFVYNNRRQFGTAARAAANAARAMRNVVRNKERTRRQAQRRTNFSPTNVGQDPNTVPNKIAKTHSNTGTNEDTRTLYSALCSDILQNTTEDTRLRRVINLKGLKVCFEYINLDATAHYVNVCLLAPKSGAATVTTADFFRDATASRATDFSNTLTGMDFACLPINTDRYTVLHRSKHLMKALTEGTGNTVDPDKANHKLIEFYTKINRNIRYDSATGTPEAGEIYLVHWYDRVGAISGAMPSTSVARVTNKVLAYFTEPCC